MKLERAQGSILRALLQAWRGGWTQTAEYVRASAGVPSVDSWLRYLRLRWWVGVLRGGEDTVAVRAVMFGSLHDGSFADLANPPWFRRPHLVQLARDVRVLGSFLAPGIPPPPQAGAGLLRWLVEVPRSFFRAVLSPTPLPGLGRGAPPGFEAGQAPGFGVPCPECGVAFDTNKGMQAHRRVAHGVRDVRRDLVTTERCPACLRLFSSIAEARRHFGLGKCAQSREPGWDARAAAQAVARAVGEATVRGRGGRGGGRGRT
jgi:uncharacterized C2H2 Zn-finger protein